MARKSKELEYLKEIFKFEEQIEEEEIENLEIDKNFILDLQTSLEVMSDNRNLDGVKHSLESIVLIVIFGLMANCNTFLEIYFFMHKHKEWIYKHILLDNGLPSLSTIKRVIGMINPRELENICVGALSIFIYNNEVYYKDEDIEVKDIKTMDGKTANSSDRSNSIKGKISKANAMSLLSVKNDVCEATEFINDKTNEIPTGIELLKRVDIKDCIVVFDALSTQIKTIEYISNNGGYYVAPVKGNQGILEEEIKLYFSDKKNYKDDISTSYYETKEKAHSTVEKREYIFVNDVNWITNGKNWKGLKSIGKATRTYKNKEGKTIQDTRFFISNIDSKKIKLISNAIRSEWHIENGLHLYLDMTFDEDSNRCFLDNSQKNLNILRKFCLAILKKYKLTTKLSMNSIRFNIGMDFENEINTIIKKTFY